MIEPPSMPGVPDAARDPVLRRFRLRRLRIPVGSGQLSVVVPDDRSFLRGGEWAPAVAKGAEPPYWVRIWPAAVAVARQLVRAGDRLRGLRVLDLGCGLGVPGIQAARGGAAVHFVDKEHEALRFATWNASHGLPEDTPAATGERLDWSRGAVAGTFDLILLSDVSYHAAHHAPLVSQLERTLADDGCVLHAEPGRERSAVFLAGQVARGYVGRQWRRQTSFQEARAEVRLSLLARGQAELRQWCDRLAVSADAEPIAGPIPGASTVASAGGGRT